MAIKRKPRAKSKVPATKKAAKGKLSGNVGKWIWIGAAAIGVIVLMNSFKSSGSSLTSAQCQADNNCLKGYWKWRINSGQDWIAEVQRKATAAGITFEAQAELDAIWIIQQGWTIQPDLMAAYLKTL